jgi:ankyrin repeat protein
MSEELNELISAADVGDLNTVQKLIASGTRVDGTVQEGLTALMAAAGSGHKPLIEALLASGADVNGTDKSRYDPFDDGCQQGTCRGCQILTGGGDRCTHSK